MNIRALLLASICLVTAAMPASSDYEPDFRGVGSPLMDERVNTHSGMSLDQAVQRVRRETGGRVLAADTIDQAAGSVHRIKVLLPSGRVRVVIVDAGDR